MFLLVVAPVLVPVHALVPVLVNLYRMLVCFKSFLGRSFEETRSGKLAFLNVREIPSYLSIHRLPVI